MQYVALQQFIFLYSLAIGHPVGKAAFQIKNEIDFGQNTKILNGLYLARLFGLT